MIANPDLLSSLNGIVSGEVSPGMFADLTQIPMHTVIEIMEWWSLQGIGDNWNSKNCTYYTGSRLDAGIVLIERGLPIHDIARRLDWRDFEGLTGRILESEGFDVQYNLIMKRPRLEIDVIGIRMNIALLIDCKHWQRDVPHSVAVRQTRRAERWSTLYRMNAVPVIVTIHQEHYVVSGVPIVPIAKFRSFTEEFFGDLEHVRSTE